jgi:hypothetical protein
MVGEGFVGWVFEKEVAVVESGSQVIGAARVGIGLCEIDGDKVPTRAEGSRGAVGDEEKSVMRAKEGVVEGTTRGWRNWRGRIGAADGRGKAVIG